MREIHTKSFLCPKNDCWFLRNLKGWSHPARYTGRNAEQGVETRSCFTVTPSPLLILSPISRMRHLTRAGFQLPTTLTMGTRIYTFFLKTGSLCCPLSVNNGFDVPAIFSWYTLKCITMQIEHVWLCTTQIRLGSTLWKRAEQMISKTPTAVSWKVVIKGQSTQCSFNKCLRSPCSRPIVLTNHSNTCSVRWQ